MPLQPGQLACKDGNAYAWEGLQAGYTSALAQGGMLLAFGGDPKGSFFTPWGGLRGGVHAVLDCNSIDQSTRSVCDLTSPGLDSLWLSPYELQSSSLIDS